MKDCTRIAGDLYISECRKLTSFVHNNKTIQAVNIQEIQLVESVVTQIMTSAKFSCLAVRGQLVWSQGQLQDEVQRGMWLMAPSPISADMLLAKNKHKLWDVVNEASIQLQSDDLP